MRYLSTRGTAPALDFDGVLLAGLARDGGLYMPESWPSLDLAKLAGLGYAELAVEVMAPFMGSGIAASGLETIARETYAGFRHRAVAPLKQLDADRWLLELFHGPTLAFKDYALQLVGRLFDQVLMRKGERITVVGATSGDTGSAAMEACRDRQAIEIFILFPHGRVSDVQRRQMTTLASANVHALAIEGSFDDCQDLVKAMFNDRQFRDSMNLSAVNSINWARIMAQIVYYVWAAVQLGAAQRRIAFAVPTGNFGNVFAAYAALRMGVPIERLIIGSNRNDILTRLIGSGEMRIRPVEPSLSPSMDIQVSSNFERLLWELVDRDGAEVAELIGRFRKEGVMRLGNEPMARLTRLFSGHRLDDDGTLAEIELVWRRTGELVDPHTAVGLAAAQAAGLEPGLPLVSLACAHPAKFPEAVESATGIRPALPAHLADLFERPERVTVLANDLAQVEEFVAGHVRLRGAA